MTATPVTVPAPVQRAPGLEDLRRLVDSIYVDPGSWTARIGDDEVTGDDRRALEGELGRRLYERTHVRWPAGRRSLSRLDRDLETEDRIAGSVGADTTRFRVGPVADSDDDAVVRLFGARVRTATAGPGAGEVELPDVWPALSPGFVMVFGTRRPRAVRGCALYRLYLGADGLDEAIPLFAAVVGQLRATATAWQAKVASSAVVYPRSDAVTVYLDPDETPRIDSLTGLLRGLPAPRVPISAFVAEVAQGVGLAQEPDDPTRGGLSFGQHRASIVARAALDRAVGGADTLERLVHEAGIDPDGVWRNAPPTH